MACGSCGGAKKAAPATLRWTVDLSPVADARFADGTTKKTFLTVQEANKAVMDLKLQGRIRPRPAQAND